MARAPRSTRRVWIWAAAFAPLGGLAAFIAFVPLGPESHDSTPSAPQESRAAASESQAAVPAEGFRAIPFNEAFAIAEAERKLVFVAFESSSSAPCRRLDAELWADESVRTFLRKSVVALRVDDECEPNIVRGLRVHFLPTLEFFRPDRTSVEHSVGIQTPERFLEVAARIVAGRTELQAAEDEVASRPLDVRARERRGRARRNAGLIPEAFEDFLYCFDEAPTRDPSFLPVRDSFLVSDLGDFARAYPPAYAALAERENAALVRLLDAPTEDCKSAREFATLARALRDSVAVSAALRECVGRADRASSLVSIAGSALHIAEKDESMRPLLREVAETLRLRLVGRGEAGRDTASALLGIAHALEDEMMVLRTFDAMEGRFERGPARNVLAAHLLETLVGRRRYADVIQATPNLARQAIQSIDFIAHLRRDTETVTWVGGGSLIGGWRNVAPTLCRSGAAFEALLGAGHANDAARVAIRMLQVFPRDESIAALAARARAVDAPERARLRAAFRNVPEDVAAEVAELLEAIEPSQKAGDSGR